MAFQYDYCVFIGRFQPFHLGHWETVKRALDISECLIVILGSYRVAPNIKNPWTAEERETLIRSCLLPEWRDRLTFAPIRDRLYDEGAWLADVRQQVAEQTQKTSSVAIIGYHKDASSYYLNLFPEWDYVPTPYYQNINSTDIRNVYFDRSTERKLSDVFHCMPNPARAFLETFRSHPRYAHLCEEFAYIQSYRQAWSVAPYPPIFVIANAVVLQSDCLLVIRRGQQPGRGTIAFPGGFLEPDETIQDGILRKLQEETQIDVERATLQSAIIFQHVFDRPQRSLRGRAIAHVAALRLPEGSLPKVRAADDAHSTWWLPLSELSDREDQFFADHYQIVRYVLSHLP
ncbi:MAG: bifunctional nicotinamide-nucleotide adenylyltransferase/Nudix hydroxylase [Cyanobacteria bacterium P01_F01_bin.33]